MSKTIYIGGRLESKEKGNVVTGANAILDDTKGKKQNVINKETDDELLRLEQSKQDNLNFDNAPTEDSTNPVTSGGVYTAEKALSDAIEAILLLIPSAATALNKLVDTNTMNSSISTATATFRGTYNAVSDLGLTYQATHAQIEAALDALGLTADNNDFVFVQIPVSDQSQDIAKTERFKFNGINWLYEYDLNTSGFTAAQWAAINSTITLALVQKLAALPTNAELLQALGLKQDVLTFDNAPTTDSNNPVKSGGIKNAIDTAVGNEAEARENADTALSGLIGDEKTRAEGVEGGLDTRLGAVEGSVSTIQGVIPSEATSSNKLVDNSSMTTYIDTIIDNIDATFNVTSTDGHVTLAITQVNGAITSVQLTTSDIASAAALNLKASQADLTALAGRVTIAEGNIDQLLALYNALQQSAPQVIQPTDTWPVANPSTTVIYRVIDRVNTPPEYYSDYMWNGTSMVLMATYNNAIDTTPKKDSANLITSGGVFANIGAFDISEYHKSGSTLATYADLTAALAALPSDFQKGGMSIKFVQSSDNKYIQARCMAQNFTTDVTQWQGVDVEPIAESKNLVESGGVEAFIGSLVGDKEIVLDRSNLGVMTSTTIGEYIDITTPSHNNNFFHYVQECNEGDIFIITGRGNSSVRVYVLLDAEQKVVDYNSGGTLEDYKLTIPAGVKYLCYNSNKSTTYPAALLYSNKDSIKAIINGYIYRGIAIPSTVPNKAGNPFYIAINKGTYTNFGNQVVEEGITLLSYNNSTWTANNLLKIDKEAVLGSDNIIVSKALAALNDYVFNIDLTKYAQVNGYISNGGVWEDVGSPVRKHIVIPVVAGEPITIIPNENYGTYASFLSAYNVQEDGDASVVLALNNIQTKKTTIVPDGAIYLYIQVNSSTNNYMPLAVYKDNIYLIKQDIESLQRKSYVTTSENNVVDVVDFDDYTQNNGYITGISFSKKLVDGRLLEKCYSGGTWSTSGGRKHIVIPLQPYVGKMCVCQGKSEYYVYPLSSYSVVDGGDSNIVPVETYTDANNKQMFEVTSSMQYLFVLYSSGANRLPDVLYFKDKEVNGTSIFDFNQDEEVLPKIENLVRPCMTYGVANSIPCATFIHFSDLHGNNANIERIKLFADKYDSYIDDVIQTGDLADYPTVPNSYKYYCTEFMNVIGNHDAKQNDVVQSSSDVYNIYMKDYIGNWGVTEPDNTHTKCYYYKDYTDSHLRLVVIDCMHWDSTQKSWLEEVLADTLDSNDAAYQYHILCAIHIPPFMTTKPNSQNSFDSIDEPMDAGGLSNAEIAGCIKDFIDEGGKFTCWICGHIHDDVMGVGLQGSGFENQLVISIATAGVTPATPYSSMARSNGNKTQDCFNLLSIDTVSSTVKIMRVGANYDRYMRNKNGLSWDYGNSRLLYVD